MKFTSTRDPALAASLARALVDGLAPDGGLYVPQALPAAHCDDYGRAARRACAATAGAVLRWRCTRRLARGDLGRGVRFPGAAQDLAGQSGAPVVARALPRADGGVQGFRGTLPRRLPRAAARGRWARPHGARGDLRRHGRRGRRRVPGPAGLSRGAALPGGPRLAGAGAAALLLGRQRAEPRRARQLRRLPAPREAGVRAGGPARGPCTHVGQQHQHRPPAAAGRAVRVSGARDPGEGRGGGELRDPVRQPRPRDRLRLGARDGPAGRRHRARAQCESHGARLSRRRPLAAPGERRDARLGDGCRRSQQHGAVDGALSRPRGRSPSRLRAASIDDAAIRASIAAEFARTGFTLCPHSAAGLAAYRALPESDRRRGHWVVVATAHAAKFPEIVEPLVGRRVEPPPQLAALLGRPVHRRSIDAELGALAAELQDAACTP